MPREVGVREGVRWGRYQGEERFSAMVWEMVRSEEWLGMASARFGACFVCNLS